MTQDNSRARPDTWIAKAPPDLGWSVADGEIRARGVYDLGYGPENAIKVTHRREIVFVRERCSAQGMPMEQIIHDVHKE